MTEPHAGNAFDDEADIEAPEADVIEQHTSAQGEEVPPRRRQTPFEANDADAAEQDQVAEADDEDDYR
jgi:hypothetical protein